MEHEQSCRYECLILWQWDFLVYIHCSLLLMLSAYEIPHRSGAHAWGADKSGPWASKVRGKPGWERKYHPPCGKLVWRTFRWAPGKDSCDHMVPFNAAKGRREQMAGQYPWAQRVSFQWLKKRAFAITPLKVKILLENRNCSLQLKWNFKNDFSIQQWGKNKTHLFFRLNHLWLCLFWPILLALSVFIRSFMKRFFSNGYITSILMVSINRNC